MPEVSFLQKELNYFISDLTPFSVPLLPLPLETGSDLLIYLTGGDGTPGQAQLSSDLLPLGISSVPSSVSLASMQDTDNYLNGMQIIVLL